ncbi:MAG: murein biosynthesis integral membrane protein MurJ [Desulfobacterales bacterium]
MTFPTSSETACVRRAAGVVASATFLSRLLGYLRDMTIAWVFGAGLYSDAFIAAFRIPNLVRRLFGEGAFGMAFIPVFSEILRRDGKADACAFTGTTLRYLWILLVMIVAASLAFAPQLVRMVAPGFGADADKFALTLSLTRIMLPYMLIVGFLALAMGVLNGMGSFAAPAFAPAFLNVAMIGALGAGIMLGRDPAAIAMMLASAVLVGGLLQVALQIPSLRTCGLRFRSGSWKPHPGLMRVGRDILPAVFGTSVFQINILIGTLLGSLLGDGSVSYLFFADRIVQFPLGIFAVSAATASLPSLSRQADVGDLDGLRRTLEYGMRHVSFVMLPAMVGLVVLREPIVSQLFEHGAFDREAARLTAQALLWYALGIWAVAAIRIISPALFALKDARTPAFAAAVSLGTQVSLGLLLMRVMGHSGIALSTSVASIINLLLLLIVMRRRLGRTRVAASAAVYGHMLGCALLMGGAVRLLSGKLAQLGGGSVTTSGLLICLTAGVVVYGGISVVTGSREMRELLSMIYRRGR